MATERDFGFAYRHGKLALSGKKSGPNGWNGGPLPRTGGVTYTKESGTAPSGTTRRSLTSRDLFRRREFYRRCASLSPEAALVAVLVMRLEGREEMAVHPGELVEDVSPLLDWKDRADPPSPELISEGLRRLGFERVGRDARGVRYAIRWESLWALDPREVSRGRVDPLDLSGAELLRLLVEDQGAFLAPRLWCPTCRRLEALLDDWASGPAVRLLCSVCEAPTERLSAHWFTRASERIRRAVRSDRTLLPRVKAEWAARTDGAPLPTLREPFAWINSVWASANRPLGRPSSPWVCYQLAHAVGALQSAGVSREQVAKLFQEPDRERRQALFQRLPDGVHRFRDTRGPGLVLELPSVNGTRLWEAVRWAHRQWTNPMARVRGERPFHVPSPGRVAPAPKRSSDVPQCCPKCRSSVLSAVPDGGRLMRIRCSACGWDAFLR